MSIKKEVNIVLTMDEIECFDIDWPWQFEAAEKLYKGQ